MVDARAQLPSDQYDRTILKLEKWNLIERRQWWFGRRNILFVRPTKVTADYVTAATTWKAATEFVGVGQGEHLKIRNPRIKVPQTCYPPMGLALLRNPAPQCR